MRINEIEYGGICSSEFGLTFGTETHSILPTLRKSTQEILGRDGEIDFGIGGYSVRIITVPVYFDGDFAELRANRERIIVWLATRKTAKKLILGSEPDKYYMARIYSGLDFTNSSDGYIGDIQFECNPPWQFYQDGTLLSPEQLTYLNCDTDSNQFYKEFTANGVIRLVNKGAPVKPIIKLYGNIKKGITLRYEKDYFIFGNECYFDGIEIDCKNETVRRISDGLNVSEHIFGFSDFFELLSGNVEISLSQDNLGEWVESVYMIVEFKALEGI